MKNKKTETVEEYLARGGKITLVPAKYTEKVQTVHSTVTGPVVIMSIEDAEMLYGHSDKKVKSVKKSVKPSLDVNALPPHLRKKFVDSVLDGGDDE